MNRIIKYFYVFITALFALFTAYEIYMYMKVDSNYFGIFYLFLNFFVMFLLFTITYNYESANRNIRISKNSFNNSWGFIEFCFSIFTTIYFSLCR